MSLKVESGQGTIDNLVSIEAKTTVNDSPNRMRTSRRKREADAWNIVGVFGHKKFQKDSWRAGGLAVVELMTREMMEYWIPQVKRRECEVKAEWIELEEDGVEDIDVSAWGDFTGTEWIWSLIDPVVDITIFNYYFHVDLVLEQQVSRYHSFYKQVTYQIKAS